MVEAVMTHVMTAIPLVVNGVCDDFEQIVASALQFSTLVGAEYKIKRRNKKRLHIVCDAGDACAFFVRARSFVDDEGKQRARIVKVLCEHTCVFSATPVQRRKRNPKTAVLLRLGNTREVVSDIVPTRGSGSVKSVQQALLAQSGVRKVGYQQAHKLHAQLAMQGVEVATQQYKMLPHYIRRCMEADGLGGTYKLQTTQEVVEGGGMCAVCTLYVHCMRVCVCNSQLSIMCDRNARAVLACICRAQCDEGVLQTQQRRCLFGWYTLDLPFLRCVTVCVCVCH